MHNSPKELIKKRLADLERIVGSDISREDKIRKAIAVPLAITEDIHKLIEEDYKTINKALDSLDHSAKDFPENKQKLLQLKKEVRNKYALPKEIRTKIIDDINRLLGINSSDNT